ncbi:MAG: hypothetical protein OEW21_02920 [Betaproteobacteria bacterium]|nr:hypothetical protein [Betaproteobacteria bacterium]
MLARARWIALGAALAAAPAMAGPFVVDLDEVRIALDSPAGFADTAFTGSPRIQELAESLTSASNRVLLFAISDADLRLFMGGDTPEFRRHMLVVTPKVLERSLVGNRDFSQLVADVLRAAGPAAPDLDLVKYLDQPPHGQPRLLAELRRTREVVSILQGLRIPSEKKDADEKPQYMLFSTTLVWLRGKALILSVHTRLDNAADMAWIRYTTERWVNDLLRLNNARR